MKKYFLGQISMRLAENFAMLCTVKPTIQTIDTRKYSKYNKSGFTIIEVLMALILIAFGAIIAINMQLNSMGAASRANHMNTATFLAESKIETLRSQKFETGRDSKAPEPPTGGEDPDINPVDYFVPKSGIMFTDKKHECNKADAVLGSTCFFRVETIVVKDSPVQQKSYQVSVRVTWFGSKGTSVVYDTVIVDL